MILYFCTAQLLFRFDYSSLLVADSERLGSVDDDGASMKLGEERQGVGAKIFTYSAAISACGKAGQWEKAIRLLEVSPCVVPPASVVVGALALK